MTDPPTTNTVSVKEDEIKQNGGEGGRGEGLVLVKEGYFRYIDILFEWCKYMNPWQVHQLSLSRDCS